MCDKCGNSTDITVLEIDGPKRKLRCNTCGHTWWETA